jgi:ADP-heptose:LPS heptosyltransferase
MTPKRSMSIERMKAIDLWLGLPLCALAGMALRLAGRLRRRPPAIPVRPRRILVMKFFGLGSVIQAGPMLRAVRQRHPESRLTFLTFDGTARLVERMRLCDDVRVIRTRGMLRFAADVLRELWGFRRQPVDVCIDLEFFSKFSTLMSVLSGAHTRIAFHLNNFWRWSIVTHPVYYNYYRHVTDVYALAAAAVGAAVADRSPAPLHLPDEVCESARRQLLECGWDGASRLVGVNVNAGELSLERRWPPERFAAVVEWICTRDGVQPVLTGAPNECDYVQRVVDRLTPAARGRAVNTAGRWSFDELIAGIRLFDFLLTNDSGPMHIAYAQGVDSISLWGVGRPSFFGPLQGNHSTFYRQLPCSPCLYMFTSEIGQWCSHRGDCMQQIGVDEVRRAVESYLETPAAERARVRVAEGW